MLKSKVKIPPYLQIKQQKDAVQNIIGKWIVRQHFLEWKGDFIIIDGIIKIDDDNLFKDISKKYNLKKPGILSKDKTIKSIRKVVEAKLYGRRFKVPAKLPKQFETDINKFISTTNEIFCGYEFSINSLNEIWDVTGIASKYTIDNLIFDNNLNEKTGDIIYKKYCEDEEKWNKWFSAINNVIKECKSEISFNDGQGLFFGSTNLKFSYDGDYKNKEFNILNLPDISQIKAFDKEFIVSVKNEKNKVLGSYITRSLFYYASNKDYIEISYAKDCITCKFNDVDNKYIGFLKDYSKCYPTLNMFADIDITLKKYKYLIPYNTGLHRYKFNSAFQHMMEEYENNIDLSTLERKILSGHASDIEMEKMLNQYKNGMPINPDVISIMCENFVFMALNQEEVLSLIEI